MRVGQDKKVNYVQVATNDGSTFSRGEVAVVGDEWQGMAFNPTRPFIGLYGYEHGDPPYISTIGFLAYQCKNVCVPCYNATSTSKDDIWKYSRSNAIYTRT